MSDERQIKRKQTISLLNYANPSESKPYIDPNLSVEANKKREKQSIFLTGIPGDVSKGEILKALKALGKVEKFWMKKAEENGGETSCYVMFEVADVAAHAIGLGKLSLDGGKSILLLPPNEFDAGIERGIFIGNIDSDAKIDAIRQLFEQFGAVEYARILRDKQLNRQKNIAFIRFVDESSVIQSMKLDGTEFEGRKLRIVRNAANPELVLRKLQQSTAALKPLTEEELAEIHDQRSALAKVRSVDEGHYGVTMMENLIKHQGKVPSSILGKKIKKLKKKTTNPATLAAKVEKVKAAALQKLNKEVFEKDNLLKARREKRKMKQKYNAQRVKTTAKANRSGV